MRITKSARAAFFSVGHLRREALARCVFGQPPLDAAARAAISGGQAVTITRSKSFSRAGFVQQRDVDDGESRSPMQLEARRPAAIAR